MNGAPIVGIATLETTNRKTGDMVQTWILPEDVHPHEAVRTGADMAVCGNCRHRPLLYRDTKAPRCYVETWKAPGRIWGAYHRDRYPLAEPAHVSRLSGRGLRIGAWGDPAAIPFEFWKPLLDTAEFHTGYTHRAEQPEGAPWRGICMASADSPQHAQNLTRAGWATFRVADRGDRRRFPWEAQCPASKEAGNKVRCASCPIKCDGAKFAAISGRVIQGH